MFAHPVCLLGLLVFIFIAWLLSENRRAFPWRTVVMGLVLQFGIGLLLLRTTLGADVFKGIDAAFQQLLSFANEGAAMVFGPLADQALLTSKLGQGHSFIFVVTVTGTIVVVSALSSLLYHYGILQAVVRCVAWVMQRKSCRSGEYFYGADGGSAGGETLSAKDDAQ
jgi:concentrative nucleoside transporter, CNT family